MSSVLGLIAALTVALIYRSLSSQPVPMDGPELMGLALSAALAALIAHAVGDYLETRRLGRPLDRRVLNALVLRNVLFAGATGLLVGSIAAYVAGPYGVSPRTAVTQFAAVTFLAGAVAYAELISRYRG